MATYTPARVGFSHSTQRDQIEEFLPRQIDGVMAISNRENTNFNNQWSSSLVKQLANADAICDH
jgi:hypothetical protein